MAICSLAEARQQILAATHGLPAQWEALSGCCGRVLAADLVAESAWPAWDNSAVDGFAVRAADVASAAENNPLHLRVVGEVAAGPAAELPLEPLTCRRVFTGAPLPAGADAVVMQEQTRPHHEGYIAVLESVEPGENIRRAGDDIAAGATLLRAGIRLGPAQVALAASLGRAELEVHRRPRVGVLATGAELMEPGQPLGPGQIYNSNGPALLGWAAASGAETVDLGIADDTREALSEKLEYALTECDVVITSGGVSVGAHDVVRPVLEELGCAAAFWRVHMRPGNPFLFAQRDRRLVFGLAGNPVSAAVTFLLLVRPALLRLQGQREVELPVVMAEAAAEFVNRGDRPHFMRARLVGEATGWRAWPVAGPGSHHLAGLAQADGLVEVAENSAVPVGATVRVHWIHA